MINDLIALGMFYAVWGGFSWLICEFIPNVVIQNYDKILAAVEKNAKR